MTETQLQPQAVRKLDGARIVARRQKAIGLPLNLWFSERQAGRLKGYLASTLDASVIAA